MLAGSVLIVTGQTVLKVSQLINESSSCKNTWKAERQPGQNHPPQW